jgi:hypothetical protein
MLEKLQAEYGRVVLQIEYLSAQAQQIKQKIAEEINKQRSAKDEEKEDK